MAPKTSKAPAAAEKAAVEEEDESALHLQRELVTTKRALTKANDRLKELGEDPVEVEQSTAPEVSSPLRRQCLRPRFLNLDPY